jgi:hypothetical protein
MATGLTLIQTQTLTSTASSITFSNIPQNFKSLVIKFSARNGSSDLPFNMQVNGGSGTQCSQFFHNDGGTKFAGRSTSGGSSAPYMYAAGTNQPSDFFSTCDVKFIDYAGSQRKQWFASYAILNSTSAYLVGRSAGYYADVTTGITSVTFSGVTFSIGTSFSLYGEGSPAMATGGTISYGNGYVYHTFTSTGSFLPSQQIKGAEILAIAGGGGGGYGGGGGGAGGINYVSYQTLNAGNTYTALVGAGGAGGTPSVAPVNGSNSILSSISATGGGGGGQGGAGPESGQNGGSGGGARRNGSVGTGVSGQGNNGGTGNSTNARNGGGGGAGAVGSNFGSGFSGAGGIGSSTYSVFGSVTNTGVLSAGGYYYAGGGGGGAGDGSAQTAGEGGIGGGGTGGAYAASGTAPVATAGTANTGGGGGGGGWGAATDGTGGAGGSGLIIVRYPLS